MLTPEQNQMIADTVEKLFERSLNLPEESQECATVTAQMLYGSALYLQDIKPSEYHAWREESERLLSSIVPWSEVA